MFLGNLYQEKVFRVRPGTGTQLPFHRFSVGDSVRITTMRGNPLGENAIDGMVIDRRQKYLDIAIQELDSLKLDTYKFYRLDCFVNRVSYDRMIEALQLFLKLNTNSNSNSSKGTNSDKQLISRTLRDIILYSYPNSMIRLAKSPGGLRLALPTITKNITNSNGNDGNSYEDIDRTITIDEIRKELTHQLDKKFMSSLPASAVDKRRIRNSKADNSANTTTYSNPTVADALESLQNYNDDDLLSNFNSLLAELSEDTEDIESEPVFATNDRLKYMASHLSPIKSSEEISDENSSGRGSRSRNSVIDVSKNFIYSEDEITEALSVVTNAMVSANKTALNPSQTDAIVNAIIKPMSLIQGPPGTGKVSHI